MICEKCGHEIIDENARVCPSCGASVDVEKLAESPEDDSASEPGAEEPESPSDVQNSLEDAWASGFSVQGTIIDVREAAADGGVGQLGPYELLGELGRGAMARVWLAHDSKLGRDVAIKEPLFDSNLSDDVLEEMGRRFVKEAKTAARLNHPGIVAVYAADVYDDNRPAIVMELVEGATLGDILNRDGKLGAEAALDVLNQLLDAVGYAHKQGVVHRDIKPENIFVTRDGRVKLADFGIAHVDDGKATRATQIGTVLGTPGYMAPEQARGGVVDARSDLFSIGVLAYEMLSGRNPFGAGDGIDSTTLLYRIVHEPPDELPQFTVMGLPEDIRPAIMAALAKNPDDRPQSAEEFKAMLSGASTTVIETGARGLVDGRSSFPRWLPYIVVAAACAIVIAVVLMNAMSSGGGGGGGGNVATAGSVGAKSPTSSKASDAAASGSDVSSVSASSALAFLAVRDGYVAVYTNSSAEPYEISDVSITDLSDADVAALDKHIGFASVEDALKQVDKYRQDIQATRAAAEERARQEAEEQARREAEERAKNTWYVCANEFVTLRASASTKSTAIVRISVREPVEYIGSAGGGWSQVRYNGSTGYVLTKFISSDPNAPLVYDDV